MGCVIGDRKINTNESFECIINNDVINVEWLDDNSDKCTISLTPICAHYNTGCKIKGSCNNILCAKWL